MKTYKNYNRISLGLIVLGVAVFGIILFSLPTSANAYYTKGYYTISDSNYTTTTTTNNNGYNENANPILTRISPSTVVRYTNKQIDVYGDYFTPNSIVKVNGANKPTSFIDQNHLIAHLSSADTANLGDQVITVMNSKTGAESNARLLKVVNATTTTAKKSTTVKKATLVRANTNTATVGPDQVVIIADRGTEIYYLDQSVNSDEVYDTENRTLSANSFFSTGGFMPTNFLQWIVLFILVLLCVYLWRKIYVTDAERNKPLKHD